MLKNIFWQKQEKTAIQPFLKATWEKLYFFRLMTNRFMAFFSAKIRSSCNN